MTVISVCPCRFVILPRAFRGLKFVKFKRNRVHFKKKAAQHWVYCLWNINLDVLPVQAWEGRQSGKRTC